MRSPFASCDASAGLRQEIAANLAGGMKPRGGFRVTLTTNIGRIARLAAKRLYQPFTVANVPEHFRQAGVVIVVEPKRPTVDRGRVELAAGDPARHPEIESRGRDRGAAGDARDRVRGMDEPLWRHLPRGTAPSRSFRMPRLANSRSPSPENGAARSIEITCF
jgi:hypothetical protein